MTHARFGSYNLLNYGQTDNADERRRIEKVTEVISGLGAHVLAVQEVIAPDEQAAGELLSKLAAAVGMECLVEPGRPAVALGHKLSGQDLYFHTGLMWRPETPLVPGSFRAFRSGDFWHSLAIGVFDIGGRKIAKASHHATPFGRHRRADEMERVVSILTRPYGRPPGMIAADVNSISADPKADGSAYYDHDWHADQDWYDDLIYQCQIITDPRTGRRLSHHADRGPGEVLYHGGLHDAAAILDAPWTPTTGHWGTERDDPFGPRRIDTIKVTRDLHRALVAYETVRTELSLAASDHVPPVLTYDPESEKPGRRSAAS